MIAVCHATYQNTVDKNSVISVCHATNQKIVEKSSFSLSNANLALKKIDLLAEHMFDENIVPKESTNFEKTLGTSFPFNENTHSLPNFSKKFNGKKEFLVPGKTSDQKTAQKANMEKPSCKTKAAFSGHVSTFSKTDYSCEINANSENLLDLDLVDRNKASNKIFDEHNYSKISKKVKSHLEKNTTSVPSKQNLSKSSIPAQNLKFFMLNVGGLKSKLKSEDLFDSIKNFDIICFLEVKIDQVELEGLKNKFDGFELFANVEKEFSNKPRGGIIILVKKILGKFVTYFPNTSTMAVFCKIDKKILESERNLICGFVYVPPHTSPFSASENFDILENEIGNLKDCRVSDLLLIGDFNSKTRDMEDRLSLNKHDVFFDLEEDCGISIGKRSSQDMHPVDKYGKKLIQLCVTLGINIVNGRAGRDAGIGKFTTRNNSVIDYALASPDLFSYIEGFEIQEFNTVLSDVHAPLSLELKCKKIATSEPKIKISPKPKWDPAKKPVFVENLHCAELDLVKEKLDSVLNSQQFEKISEVILDLNTVFENAKINSFPVKCFNFPKKNAWYDNALNRAKKNYCNARKRKNKQIKQAHGKFYKKLLISKCKTHSEKVVSNLRAIKSDDPRKYWNTLKRATKTKTECHVSPSDFEMHFKNLNATGLSDTGLISNEPNDNLNDFEVEEGPTNMYTAMLGLNKPITHDELVKALKSLKNHKATGPDQICNEAIKASFEGMKDVYLKLFNCIFDSGNFPDSWAEGLIVPIYKKKGAKDDPNNYRG